MAGTGADLENSSLKWVDGLTQLGDGTKTAQNAILANSIEQMLGELRSSYTKLNEGKKKDPDSRTQVYSSQQLANRIENSIELLPTWTRKELTALYDKELRRADRLGRESGTNLSNILRDRDATLKQNAQPNVDAINAANRRLNQFWDKENSLFTDRVKALTRNAAAQGMSWRQLSKQVRELLVLEQKQGTESARSQRVNARYGIPGRAEMIARTELQTVFLQGKTARYREMGYDHVRWSAAAERTCGFCMSRDGLVYPMEEIESAIPAHPRCRCDLIPVEVPDELKNKTISPEEAAAELDDAYWTKSRNEKLRNWKQEQNLGKNGQPKLNLKSNSELDQALRMYAQTPTNTQRYLRPGQPAPAPLYAPSGNIIPDLPAAAAGARKAAEATKKADERKRLEEEAKAAEEEKRQAEAAAEDTKNYEYLVQNRPKNLKPFPKKDWDNLTPAGKKKLLEAAQKYAEAAAKPKPAKKKRTPKEIKEAGLEAGWKSMDPEQQAKLLAKVKEMNAKVKAANDAAAKANKQGKALNAKVTKTRIEDRITQKVIEPKGAAIKAKDFGDALKLLTKQGSLVGLNTRRLMAFQERYNIATITGTGNEKDLSYILKSRQMRSSLKAAQARKTDTNKQGFGNDRIFKEILRELETYDNPVNQPYAKSNLKVDRRFGVGGSTANGQGAVNVKTSKYHQKHDAKTLKELQDAVEKSIVDSVKGKPHIVTSSSTHNHAHGKHYVSRKDWLSNYIHEMGHQIHYAVGTPMPPLQASGWTPSRYGITNRFEWFAETFTQYTLAPKSLKQAAPEAYQFIDDMVKRALTGRPGEVGRAEKLGQEAPVREISKDLIKQGGKTLKQLKADAKAAGLKGYSKLKKAELEKLLEETPEKPAKTKEKAAAPSKDLSKQTVTQLKKLAKEAGLKGYSKLKKAELVEALSQPVEAKPAGIKKAEPKAKPNTDTRPADVKAAGISKEVWEKQKMPAETWDNLPTALKWTALKGMAQAKPAAPKAEPKPKTPEKKFESQADKDARLVKQANDEIKKLSQKALTGKFTAADQAALAKWKKQREDVLGTGKPVEKIEKSTKDIDFEYDSKQWESYGYKSRAAMEQALGDLYLWTGAEYEQIRAQQLANLRKTSPNKLSKYEKNKAQEMKDATDMEALIFSADEYSAMGRRLEDFVRKAPNYDGRIYRGMNLPDATAAEALIKDIANGKASNTLESWSNSKSQADKFTYTSPQGYAAEGKAGINFRVKNRDGSPVASQSSFESENEVLVPSGQRYRVKKVTKRIKEAPWKKGENYEIFDVDLEVI